MVSGAPEGQHRLNFDGARVILDSAGSWTKNPQRGPKWESKRRRRSLPCGLDEKGRDEEKEEEEEKLRSLGKRKRVRGRSG